MKLTVILLFGSLMAMSATTYSQNTKLNLSAKNSSLIDIFRQIEDQSEFYFYFKKAEVKSKEPISIEMKDALLTDILDQVLAKTGLEYKIIDRYVVVKDKGSADPAMAVQQAHKVTGKVTDQSGATLPSVSVVVKGTTTRSITDVDGNYSLSNIPENATLQFSFVGMRTREVEVGNQTIVNVVLEEETIGIEEVIAIGYGTQKKVNLTGAISSVSSNVLKDRPLTSLGQGLQGTIANLNINPVDGEPGRAATFNIRGYTGLGTSGSPLILVDGVIMDPNLINPSDVASVTVLKDAASSAIYGARAAYGVILITTKNGKKNQAAKVNFASNFSINQPSRYPKIANSWESLLYHEAGFGVAQKSQDYKDKLYAHYKDPSQPYAELMGNKWEYFANTDWYHEALLDNASSSKQDINISGGTDKSTYYFSGGLQDQGGLFRYGNDNYKKYNFRSDVSIDLKSWLTVNFKGIYTKTDYDAPSKAYGIGNDWHSIVKMPAHYPVKTPEGEWVTDLTNPIQFLSDGGRYIKNGKDSWVVFGVEIRPFEGFKIKSDYSWNSYASNERDYKKALFTTLPNGIITPTIYTTSPFAWQQNSTSNYYAFNVWGEYEKTFNKIHYFKALLGFNQEKSDSRYFNAKRYDPINTDIGEISLATGLMESNSGVGDWAVRGLFFRLNYIFNEKYLFEMNSRYDGSSKFPKNDRFGFFPSVSAGWRISNESFMNWMKPVIDELKFRASYGSLGNQNVEGNYPYISTMDVYRQDDAYSARTATFLDGTLPMNVDPSGLVSPSLTWVKLKTLDFGFDYSMLKNRLNLTYDWYNRKTEGILGTQAAPSILGTNPPLQNLYNMETRGWELTFSWKDRINKNLSYNIGFNLSDYKGEVTKYDANPTNYIFDFYNGQTLGEIWGWKADNLFQTNEEATAWENKYKQSLVFGTPPGGYMAGDMKFEDINKNGSIDKGTETIDNPGDRKIIGNNTPRYSFGITSGIQWKGFDITAFFQGVGKRDWQMGTGNNSSLLWGNEATWQYNLDYWSPENTTAYYPRVTGTRIAETTRYLQNAAYIRLKSLIVGYTIPKTVVHRIGIEEFRIYFSGQNLWTYSKLCEGVDPEAIADPRGWPGADGQVYPIQKTLSVGINVTF